MHQKNPELKKAKKIVETTFYMISTYVLKAVLAVRALLQLQFQMAEDPEKI